jgi:hypothetical protein
VYGPVRTVVWQGSAGDRRPYADLTPMEPAYMLRLVAPATIATFDNSFPEHRKTATGCERFVHRSSDQFEIEVFRFLP